MNSIIPLEIIFKIQLYNRHPVATLINNVVSFYEKRYEGFTGHCSFQKFYFELGERFNIKNRYCEDTDCRKLYVGYSERNFCLQCLNDILSSTLEELESTESMNIDAQNEANTRETKLKKENNRLNIYIEKEKKELDIFIEKENKKNIFELILLFVLFLLYINALYN